jgi:chorismate dehydratase
MARYRIGSVPYLNGRPLVRYFRDTAEGRDSGIEIVEAVPSQLARMITDGSVDAALVSSFTLFQTPGLTYAPGCGVTADGPVESVRVISKVPIPDIRTLALDTSSLTSAALTRIVLAETYGLTPSCRHAAPDLDAMLAEADAALLIGDAGYRSYDPSLVSLDLGVAWKVLTGLPFVYALWIGRPDRLRPELVEQLHAAKEWGKAHLDVIAQREHTPLGETLARTRHYLTEIMRYDVGVREEQALALFGEKLRHHGLAGAKTPESIEAWSQG